MTNMYIRRNLYDNNHFTVDELMDGEIVIRMSAEVIDDNLATAGNTMLNKLLVIAEEIHKFSSTYIDPFAQPTVRPRRGPVLPVKPSVDAEDVPDESSDD